MVRKRDLVAARGRWRVERALARGALVEVAPGVVAARPLPERGRWVVGEHGPDPAYLLLTAAELLSAGRRAAARARTAAVLLGAELLDEPEGVELVLPHGGRPPARPGVEVRTTRRASQVLQVPWPGVGVLRATAHLDTVAALAEERTKREAVAVLDGFLRRGRVTHEELSEAVARGVLRSPRGRAVAAASDAGSESVLESAARVGLLDAGLGGFVSQRVLVGRRGRLVGRVDFCWEAERLVLEVDGDRFHEAERDRRRDRRAVGAGWSVMRAGWSDVLDGTFLVDVADALCRPLVAA